MDVREEVLSKYRLDELMSCISWIGSTRRVSVIISNPPHEHESAYVCFYQYHSGIIVVDYQFPCYAHSQGQSR